MRRGEGDSGDRNTRRMNLFKETHVRKIALAAACIVFIILLGIGPARAHSVYTTLNVPGAVLTYASGMSGNTIVGQYEDTNGVYHGFLYKGDLLRRLLPRRSRQDRCSSCNNGRGIREKDGQGRIARGVERPGIRMSLKPPVLRGRRKWFEYHSCRGYNHSIVHGRFRP